MQRGDTWRLAWEEADGGGGEGRDFQTEEQAQRKGQWEEQPEKTGEMTAEGGRANSEDMRARPFFSADQGETEAQSGGVLCPHSKAEP